MPPQDETSTTIDLGSFSAAPQAKRKATDKEWYYVSPTGRRGPINKHQLQELAAGGGVDSATLVWKSGFPDWIAFSRICQFPEEAPTAELPPTASPRNLFAWTLSLAPLWGTMIQVMATDSRIALTHEKLANYSEMWWIMVGLNVIAAYLDLLRFNKGGPEGGANKPVVVHSCAALYLPTRRYDKGRDDEALGLDRLFAPFLCYLSFSE